MFLSHWDAPGARLVFPLGPSEYICSRVPRHALGFGVSGQPTPHTTHQTVPVAFSLLIQKNVAMSPLSKPLHFLPISENWHRVGEHFGVTREPTVHEKGRCEVLRGCRAGPSMQMSLWCRPNSERPHSCSGGHFPPRTPTFYKMKTQPAHVLSQGWHHHTMRSRMQACSRSSTQMESGIVDNAKNRSLSE